MEATEPVVRTDPVIAGCVVGGAIGALFAGTAATGITPLDLLWAGGLGAVVPWASTRAARWTLLLPPAVAAGLGAPASWPLIAAAVIASLLATMVWPAAPRWAATSGLVSVLALLHLDPQGFYGLPSLAAGVALLPLVATAWRRRSDNQRASITPSWVRRGLVVAVFISALATLGTVSYGTWHLAAAERQADAGTRAATEGRSGAATHELRDAAVSFRKADRAFGSWWQAAGRAVPLLGPHLQTAELSAHEATSVANATANLIEAADYRTLRSNAGQFDLRKIHALDGPIEETKREIDASHRRVAHGRSPWLLPPADHAIDRFQDTLVNASSDLDLALAAVRVAPAMLGASGERHHLVIFVTPAELRGSGGFIGSYAELSAMDGHLELVRTGSAGSLEQAAPSGGVVLSGPPEYLARYGHLEPGRFFRDLTFSPQFPDDAEAIRQAYEQINGVRVDTVTSIDPVALAALLRVTGPVYVPKFGRVLDEKNAAPFLLSENYAQFPDDATQTAALAQLVEVVFEQLTTGDLPGPSSFSTAFHGPASAGHLRLWSPNPREQALFQRIGVSGAFPSPAENRDFLSVATQNSGNNKLDIYQHRSIDYRVDLGRNGHLRAKATIRIRNATPLDAGLSAYVAGNRQGDPIGTNRMLISVYSPHQLDTARLDGHPIGVAAQQEAGYQVYTCQITLPAGATAALELDLEGTGTKSGPYVLDHVAQPMLQPQELRVSVRRNGRLGGQVDTVPTGLQSLSVDDGQSTVRSPHR